MLIADDLNALLEILPDSISDTLARHEAKETLIEIVLDLGCKPEARFLKSAEYVSDQPITWYDLEHSIRQVKDFGKDNRAGIEKTLHRISCIRNRRQNIVGLTCRVGRALFGTISFLRDLVEQEKSILVLGKPGVGKTTVIRELSRILSDEMGKRVVIIDTSNEIAGDGDIPHPSIGKARRMQVPEPELQHQVMIEAVENHMPEVIIIDEIGTELEAVAARTIAERGVQLIGTAHGNSVSNLIKNPTLSDLVGGIQYVTLSDEEARRRGTQKSILERKESPTFEIGVEIKDRTKVVVHLELEKTVDKVLRNELPLFQVRKVLSGAEKIVYCKASAFNSRAFNSFNNKNGKTRKPGENKELKSHSNQVNSTKLAFLKQKRLLKMSLDTPKLVPATPHQVLFLYSYQFKYDNLQYLIDILKLPIVLTKKIEQAHVFLSVKSNFPQNPEFLQKVNSFNIRTFYLIPNDRLNLVSKALRRMVNLKNLAI